MQKNVVLTGASSGIGKATAFVFAGKGYGLYLTARRTNRLQEMESVLM